MLSIIIIESLAVLFLVARLALAVRELQEATLDLNETRECLRQTERRAERFRQKILQLRDDIRRNFPN